MIFPSIGGPASHDVEWPIAEFLGKSNRFPSKTQNFFFRAVGYPKPVQITADRGVKMLPTLTLTVKKDDVAALRELGWDAFRQLQTEFATFLLKKSGPAYPLSKPAERFNEFEENLQKFWVECLQGAGFSDFRQSHLTSLQRLAPDTQAGKAGAIPLQAGMRLVVHWGGVANYSHGASTTVSFTRQTSSGTTAVNIVRRGDALSLGPLANFKLRAVFPFQPPGTNANKALPFGRGSDGNYEGRIVPVFNEHDLHFLANPALATKHLALFVPHEYTKADQARMGQTGGGVDVAVPFTSDAMGTGSAVTAELLQQNLARRFVLWGQSTEIDINSPPTFKQTDVQAWPAPALVFGNQSWVDVECGISLNNSSLEWMPLGSTLSDVLEAHARWALDSEPSSSGAECLVRLQRATLRPERSGAYAVHEYRFWGVPARDAASIELHPGDAITLKP